MLEVIRKLNQFVDRSKQPYGLDLGRMFSSILLKQNFDSVGSWHVRSLFLGMMHFQDKYNEDLERLQRCDIHYLTPDLRIIPFCAFNVIPEWYRDRIQKKYSVPVERLGKRTWTDIRSRVVSWYYEKRQTRGSNGMCNV